MITRMKCLKLPTLVVVLIFSAAITTPIAGQQKRRTPEKTPAKAPAAPAPTPAPAPPTFDTLLAANSFKVYGEVRNVGQLIRSSAANDVLDPVLKFGRPPKDFIDFVNWLKAHADQLTSSRLLVAAWPTFKDVPDVVVAIEFSSPEEAAKFEKPLDGLMPTLLPPTTPQSSPDVDKKPQTLRPDQKPPEPIPGYYLQRAGSLLIVSTTAKVNFKKLRPPSSKLLSEDPNFRVAYNRFASEPIFVFIDFQALEKERAEQEKRWEEEQKKAEEARKAIAEKQKAEVEQTPETADAVNITETQRNTVVGTVGTFEAPTKKEPDENEAMSVALTSIGYSLFSGRQPELPDALGIGFSPDADSFDLRALIIDAAGKTSDPIPFFSALKLAAPIAPQSPSILPANSELVLTMSLDYAQIYERISNASPSLLVGRPASATEVVIDASAPFAGMEKILKIKVKDDVIPLLGPEVAVSLPMTGWNPFGPPPTPASTKPEAKDEAKEATPEPTPRSPFVVISLRDKEAMRQLLPKILEGFAGKAATSLAQTERREDTELVSYANMFAYAFVGNFLVLSGDAAATRYVVDSYLKGETLASNPQFRNYTRWQPHEVQGQIYISPAFAETYKAWANSPNVYISDEARSFFARLTATTQPITYSLSNDGFGTLHELHVPKSIVMLAVASASTAETPPETVKNERKATAILWSIASAEAGYKASKGPNYGSLEQLIETKHISKEALENSGYKFDLTLVADGFQISAVPVEYGKTGKLSYFMDHTYQMRGADHGGGAASASDPPIK
jgi:hypothetical protein